MKYIGIDPSYSKTGYCVIDYINKTITVDAITPEGKNDTYKNAVYRALEIIRSLELDALSNNDLHIIFEEPMVTSLKASRLGILSGVLAAELIRHKDKHIKEYRVSTINPVVLTQLKSTYPNKEKLNKKQLSYIIATKIIEILTNDLGYTHIIKAELTKKGIPKKRKMSHDEAEAFLMALVITHEYNKQLIPHEQWVKIYSINKGFYTKNLKVSKLT